MKVLSKAFGLVAALAIIVGGIYLLILAIRSGSASAVALLAGAFTLGGAVVARYYERQRAMQAVRRQEMGDLYLEMAAVLLGRELPATKRDEVVSEFMRKSLLYASGETLRTFRAWREVLPDDAPEWTPKEEHQVTLLYEAFIKSLRTDLGNSNWYVQEGDLARTIRPDFDDLIA